MRGKPVTHVVQNRKVLGLLAAVAVVVAGCSTPAVGDPCLPEQVPESGFDDKEAYIESSSVQCETRVCIVFRLKGDPREDCKPGPNPSCAGEEMCEDITCPSQGEIDERVYCTCRCDSGESGFAECECPDGFSCFPVLEQGGPGVRGSYCVRDGTFTRI